MLRENGCCYCFIDHHIERIFISHPDVEYALNPDWLNGLNISRYKCVCIYRLEVEEGDGDELIEMLRDIDATVIFAPGPHR
ncbi:hypothetical protein KFX46_08580 [Macrococcus canis]|uniref:hypothetical protein n=1 Tax=Macrococcoides canis TaxID=1855823 RepID=UPI00207CE6B2|nr:hypothetical protein [Macrococcus canis]MCO4097063.1 hypothetical protein [Macrococcus canis]